MFMCHAAALNTPRISQLTGAPLFAYITGSLTNLNYLMTLFQVALFMKAIFPIFYETWMFKNSVRAGATLLQRELGPAARAVFPYS